MAFTLNSMKRCTMLSFFLASCYSSFAQWEVVGDAGFSDGLVYNITMEADAAGTPYVAFADGANGQKPTVMKFDGSEWVTVGNAGISENIALSPILKLDAGGTPFVAFADGANGQRCSVMKFDGSNWVYVGTPGFTAGLLSLLDLAIAPDGMPYVAFGDQTKGNRATVMKYIGTGWEIVGNPGFSPNDAGYTQIAIAGNGTPYSAYLDVPFGTLTVKSFDGSHWVAVGDTSFVQDGTTPQLLLDKDDAPYLAYLNGGGIGVQKFTGTGSTGWEMIGGVFSTSTIPSYLTFDINAAGTPYVAYSSQADSFETSVKKFDNGSWSFVGSEPAFSDTSQWPVVALDENDNVYLAFEDYTQSRKLTVVKFKEVNGIFTPQSSKSELEIFPNPASDVLHVTDHKYSGTEKLYVTIRNVEGKIMLQKNYNDNTVLDISRLLPGIYNIAVITEGLEIRDHALLVKQ